MAKITLISGEDIPKDAVIENAYMYVRYSDPNRNNERYEKVIGLFAIETKDDINEGKDNGSVLEKFIEEITNEVSTDDKILLNTPKIEVGTKMCIPDKFIRKEIILSWVELKGE